MQLYDESKADLTLYTLDGYAEKRATKKGSMAWNLTINDPDYSLYWLRWYTRESGGTCFPGTRDHSTFLILESDTVSWWADAQQTEYGTNLTIIRVTTVPIGKPITIRPSEEGDRFIFYTPPTSGKLQSAEIRLEGDPNCDVWVEIGSKEQWRRYSYETNRTLWDNPVGMVTPYNVINRVKTDRFVLDDLPITEGELGWTLEWGNNDAPIPEQITIQITADVDIPTVKWEEAPRAIRVMGAPDGCADVAIPQWGEMTHGELVIGDHALMGIPEPDGSVFFAASVGYYHVTVPSGVGSQANTLRLIPVNAGEITTVTVPPEAKISAGALFVSLATLRRTRAALNFWIAFRREILQPPPLSLTTHWSGICSMPRRM